MHTHCREASTPTTLQIDDTSTMTRPGITIHGTGPFLCTTSTTRTGPGLLAEDGVVCRGTTTSVSPYITAVAA